MYIYIHVLFFAFATHLVTSRNTQVCNVPPSMPARYALFARLAKVLQEMRLNEPPISMARFVHGMGSVPAETAFKALDANQDNEPWRGN